MKTELVTTLKRRAKQILSDLHRSGEPVLITEHEKPSAYLIDVDSYEFTQRRMQILDGIGRGERAILEKCTNTHDEAKRTMGKWLN